LERNWKVFDEKVEEFDIWYDLHAKLYSCEVRLISSFELQKPVIEIGIGTGRFSKFAEVEIGIDPSIEALRLAKKRGTEVVMAVGEAVPFRKGSFGTALIPTTICFTYDPKKVIEEVGRVAEEILLCFVPMDSTWGEWYTRMAKDGHPFYSGAKFYGLARMRELLIQTGFELIEEKGTLTFGPEEERVEDPTCEVKRCGYVCIKARSSE